MAVRVTTTTTTRSSTLPSSFPLLVSRNESYLLIVVHSILRLILELCAPKTPFASVLLVAS